MKINDSKYKSYKGIGLLELILSLTLIAVLLLGALKFYQTTSLSHKVANVVDRVLAINFAANRWLFVNNDFSNLPESNILDTFVNHGLLSEDFRTLQTPWGGTITVTKSEKANCIFVNIEVPIANSILGAKSKEANSLIKKLNDVVCSISFRTSYLQAEICEPCEK